METKLSDYKDLRHEDPSSLSARDKILRTAVILFNKGGVHTTGIDRIIAEADVAKMTFYKHFPSKMLLVEAYLENQEQACFVNMSHFTTERTNDPKEQLLGVFDFLEEWFKQPDFKGCAFARGLSDFGDDKDSPAYQRVQAYFGRYAAFIEERLVKILKPAKIKVALPQLMTLVAGSIVAAVATGDARIAQINKLLVRSILEGP